MLIFARFQCLFCVPARYLRCAARFRRRQLHPCPASLRQSDCNRLLRRSSSVLAFPDVFHFLADKFSCLCAGGLAHAPVPRGTLQSPFFSHGGLLKISRYPFSSL